MLFSSQCTTLFALALSLGPVALPVIRCTGTGPWLIGSPHATGGVVHHAPAPPEDAGVTPAGEINPAAPEEGIAAGPPVFQTPPDTETPDTETPDTEPPDTGPPAVEPPAVDTPDTEPPPAEPPIEIQADIEVLPAAADLEVIQLLDELEAAGAELEAFTADLHYVVEDGLEGERIIRTGSVVYRIQDDRQKQFAIVFRTRQRIEPGASRGTRREGVKHYVFADRFFYEIDHEDKLFIAREVVAKDETFDPLRLGEGPFPLPVGQPRDEVLERFIVASATLPEEGPLRPEKMGDVEVDGLSLVPRSGSRAAEDIARMDLFYDRETRLPVGVFVLEHNGDKKTARLSHAKRNPILDAEALALLDVHHPDPTEWQIDIRPLE